MLQNAAPAQAEELFESALSFKGQTLSIPGNLGSLTRTLDCDPKQATKITLQDERLCNFLDGVRYEDLDVPGLKLTLYDISLLPASSSDAHVDAFIKGKPYLEQVLDGRITLASYGNLSGGGSHQQFMPPMTRETQTLAVADTRILKIDGKNVGVAYVAADGGSDNEQPYKLYMDFVFFLPKTHILGVYTIPLTEANIGTNSFSSYAAKQLTATVPADRTAQLEIALDTYVAKNISNTPGYTNIYDTVHQMLASAQPTPFIDVFPSTDFAEAILAIRSQGVIQGYPDGSFKPGKYVNRAEFMKILLEAAGIKNIDKEAAACFPDVDKSQWYAKYVCYGEKKGIIEGYSDGTFRPEATINLAEALKITFKTYNINVGSGAGEWYQPYLDEARKRGMLVLMTTRIGDNVTRGEMAELMYRLGQSQ